MEIWKAIKGFELYEVSSLGSIRNVKTNLIKKQRKENIKNTF